MEYQRVCKAWPARASFRQQWKDSSRSDELCIVPSLSLFSFMRSLRGVKKPSEVRYLESRTRLITRDQEVTERI